MSSVLANNISGKVVVITGGSSGLGETTARHLASLGASVVLGARRIDKLEAIAADIRTAGGKVAVQATDVTSQDEVKALVNLAQERFGKVDVVINNAGLMAIAPLAETRVDEWDRMQASIKGYPVFPSPQALKNLGLNEGSLIPSNI